MRNPSHGERLDFASDAAMIEGDFPGGWNMIEPPQPNHAAARQGALAAADDHQGLFAGNPGGALIDGPRVTSIACSRT